MFKRTHHQAIEQVLRLMNADLLKAHQCYFGGGTVIALQLDWANTTSNLVTAILSLRGVLRKLNGI